MQIMGHDFLDVVHAMDISEGGAKIKIPHLFKGCDIQAPVDLIVKLPAAPAFRARGIIRHIDGGVEQACFGVEFGKLAPADKERLHSYVQERIALGSIV